MHYFTLENDNLILNEVETLPPEIEEIFKYARKKYTIKYSFGDWYNGDTDAGMGFSYSNSVTVYREPFRNELLISDGKLYGFVVNYNKYYKSLDDVLVIGENRESIRDRSLSHEGEWEKWTLIIEEEETTARYVFFKSSYWPVGLDKHLVESGRISFDFDYGNCSKSLEMWKLTPEAIKDPDGVLKAYERCNPMLVKRYN